MDEHPVNEAPVNEAPVNEAPVNEKRIMEQLDRMVETGRITAAEAKRLRKAAGTKEFATALNEVRARHATVHLDRAVADGRMSTEEAGAYLERVRAGDHSRELRSDIRRPG